MQKCSVLFRALCSCSFFIHPTSFQNKKVTLKIKSFCWENDTMNRIETSHKIGDFYNTWNQQKIHNYKSIGKDHHIFLNKRLQQAFHPNKKPKNYIKCSTLWAIKKLIKTKMRHHFTLSVLEQFKNPDNSKCWQGCGTVRCLYDAIAM